MIKIYQFKWGIRIAVILMITVILTRGIVMTDFGVGDAVVYIVYNFIIVFTAWTILGFFRVRSFRNINSSARIIISTLAALLSSMFVMHLFTLYFPANRLILDREGHTLVQQFFVRLTPASSLILICNIVLNNVYANDSLQNARLEHEHLKQEHLKAQLLSLQQQVSPHFLFNSLNTLKTMIDGAEPKNYIIQLSKVYRHVLDINKQHLTTLEEELDFLKSYIYILNLRFEDSLVVLIEIQDEYLNYLLPPLSLQLLVENALKHNVSSNKQPLKIVIRTSDQPAIIVENNYLPINVETESMGLGLHNIVQRYRLLVQQPIEILNDESNFSVTLPLLKHESNYHRG